MPGAFIATWFGAGLLRPAPGTWGSLAALPLGIAVLYLAGPWALAVVAVAVFGLGMMSAGRLIASFPQGSDHDHGAIVVDEVAGQLIALIPAMLSPLLWVAAFLLFRLFDIWKPWPIRRLDRDVPGVLGVMADDIVAGIFAAVGVFVLAQIGLADV
ncbi:MAG: phosphatidylglycerophosphatase A [Rhodospirillales bacterium]|nr:phosphatidylglycerophosphatase A [Rhodospirillales bacterium]